jgi:hypothetical protein
MPPELLFRVPSITNIITHDSINAYYGNDASDDREFLPILTAMRLPWLTNAQFGSTKDHGNAAWFSTVRLCGDHAGHACAYTPPHLSAFHMGHLFL